jgi:hypothetical protein
MRVSRLRMSRPRGAPAVAVRHRLLDAHIHIALAIRQIGELVRAIDQLGRDRPRVPLLNTLKNCLHPQLNA